MLFPNLFSDTILQKKKAFLVFGAVIIFSLIIFVYNILGLSLDKDMVSHTNEVRYYAERAMRSLEGAEASVRTYTLIRSNSSYDHYERFKKMGAITIDSLVVLVKDNPIQSSRVTFIQEKINQRIKILDTILSIAKATPKSLSLPKSTVPIGTGLALEADIQILFDRFMVEERTLLKHRSNEATQATIWAIVSFSVVTLLLSSTALLIFFRLRKEMIISNKTQRIVEESERRFRALVEYGNDVICLLNKNGELDYASNSLSKLLAVDMGELLGKRLLSNIRVEDTTTFEREWEQILANPKGKRSLQFRFVRPDGSAVWVEGALSNMLFFNSVRAVVLNFRDVSGEKRAAFALKQASERAQKHAYRLQFLNTASAKINSALSASELLKIAVTICRDLLNCHQVDAIVSIGGEVIHQLALSQEYWDENIVVTPPDINRIKNLFTDDFGVLFPQETIELDHNLFEELMIAYYNQPPINGWMGAALSIGGEIIGYLCVKDKVESHFSEDEKNLLIQLTLICSSALENQKLSSLHTFAQVPSVL